MARTVASQKSVTYLKKVATKYPNLSQLALKNGFKWLRHPGNIPKAHGVIFCGKDGQWFVAFNKETPNGTKVFCFRTTTVTPNWNSEFVYVFDPRFFTHEHAQIFAVCKTELK